MSDREGMGDVILCGCGCGGSLTTHDAWKRERRYLPGHNITALWRTLKACKQQLDVPRETTVEIQAVR